MGETRATLSVVTSRVRRIVIGHAEAAELDAGFDGGEFSGPAHMDMEYRQVRDALKETGWTAREFLAEVEARTTVKWAFFCGLFSTVDVLAGDELQDKVEQDWELQWDAQL
jgi:hypothetical protein